MKENDDIIIYQTEDGVTRIDVRLENETVWLTQQQMADLYQTSRTNVVEHIRHIYDEQELDEISTCRNFRQVRQEGNRQSKSYEQKVKYIKEVARKAGMAIAIMKVTGYKTEKGFVEHKDYESPIFCTTATKHQANSSMDDCSSN